MCMSQWVLRITKGEVKAKLALSVGKGMILHSSLAGGALPARPCRNVDEAERERTRCDPKDRGRTMSEKDEARGNPGGGRRQ